MHVHPKKRKHLSVEDDDVEKDKGPVLPGGGTKGVSSGLSTIVKSGGGGSPSNGWVWRKCGGEEVVEGTRKRFGRMERLYADPRLRFHLYSAAKPVASESMTLINCRWRMRNQI